MQIEDLSLLSGNTELEADLVIIGGGPAGLTIARQFFNSPFQVIVLESGKLEEHPEFSALNQVESIGEPKGSAQAAKRIEFHGAQAESWSHETQPYGVRCRVLGGSSLAWAGKCAAFDPIDFARRPWVHASGWPFCFDELAPYLDRAAIELNLGPNCYNDSLWDKIGVQPPEPQLNPKLLRSFFWQFSRSRLDALDIMRFGSEFTMQLASNVRVFVNATATGIETNAAGTAFQSLRVSSIDGRTTKIRAKAVVLAAGGIENPRLLLTSNNVHSRGLGNSYDNVGRYLMDHPSSRVGYYDKEACKAVAKRFGFYGVQHLGRAYMYMHGVTLSKEIMEREGLLNCAAYMLEKRSPDDPWDALKRLLRRRSQALRSDVFAVCKSPGLVFTGAGMRLLESDKVPAWTKNVIINTMIRYNPNFVVREFTSRGLPHKLDGLTIDAICEQQPNPESRITLSNKRDLFGIPMACVNWSIDRAARRSLIRIAKIMNAEFARIGLPTAVLDDWVKYDSPDDAIIIDMAHTLGTTRMSENPKDGVVDANCKLHGVDGVYVAGGSVFPTSGHANPTVMIVALAIRLADRLKRDLSPSRSHNVPDGT